MQLSSISISAISYDNEPFVRALTATVMSFTRVGTSTANVRASGSELIRWNYPSNSFAIAISGNNIRTPYIPSSAAPVSSIGTMVFYFTAENYNPLQVPYVLNDFTVSVDHLSANVDSFANLDTTFYTEQYDFFPDIELGLFINHEHTYGDPTFFYRLTADHSYAVSISAKSPEYPFTTTTLSGTVSGFDYYGWYTLDNNNAIKYFNPSGITSFARNITGTKSVQLYLSANGSPNSVQVITSSTELTGVTSTISQFPTITSSLIGFTDINEIEAVFGVIQISSIETTIVRYPAITAEVETYTGVEGFSANWDPGTSLYTVVFPISTDIYTITYPVTSITITPNPAWYTPHIITRSLSARFIPRFLSADFIGFPTSFFDENSNLQNLNLANYTLSPGLCFFSEGHTERINLSALQPTQVTINPATSSFGTQLTNNLSGFYNWVAGDYAVLIPTSSTFQTVGPAPSSMIRATSAQVIIPTEIGDSFSVPVALYVLDPLTNTLTSDPVVYYDDITGEKQYYPYFTSTIPSQISLDSPGNTDRIFITFGTTDTFGLGGEYTQFDIYNNRPRYRKNNDTTKEVYYSYNNWRIRSNNIDRFINESDSFVVPSLGWPTFINVASLLDDDGVYTSRFKQNIQAVPYPDVLFRWIPGAPSIVTLPLNYLPEYYTAALILGLSGSAVLDPCYGKYDYIWKWSTFGTPDCLSATGCIPCSGSSLSGTLATGPSSWSTMGCFDIFAKKWRFEPGSTAYISPIECVPSNLVWTVSTYNWTDVKTIQTGNNNYQFSLQYLDYGQVPFTVSDEEDVTVTLTARQTVACIISGLDPRFDWKIKETVIEQTHNILSLAPPKPLIYTSNRCVLTGTDVRFHNLIRNKQLIKTITVNYDDNKVQVLTGADIYKDFIIQYNRIGFKTLKIQVETNYSTVLLEKTFPGIIRVVTNYDDIIPESYQTRLEPLQLPWPDQPKVYSNDWIIEDNINSSIEKFYKNIEYLQTRGIVYAQFLPEYFGYLGPAPVLTPAPPPSVCPQWTWEQLDCIEFPESEQVTWSAVYSATDTTTLEPVSSISPTTVVISTSALDPTGKWATCGTWEQQICTPESLNPVAATCLGKYCVNWDWKSRREKNTTSPITWKQARLNNDYEKRWYFEICDETETTICNEGYWHVNIPGLDRYYPEIANCSVTERCKYRSIVSKDNMIYVAQQTQIKILSSDYSATYLDYNNKADDFVNFANIKRLALDSKDRYYVLDDVLSQVSVYEYIPELGGRRWKFITSWGGIGGRQTKNKFFNPNDLHVDQYDSVWICDSGNKAIKHYTSTGAWIQTINDPILLQEDLISVAVDSQLNVHVLTKNKIIVFNYTGSYLYDYEYTNILTTGEIVRISPSHNREIMYVASNTEIIKFFRTGTYAGPVLSNIDCATNIIDVYHDEFRNLLVVTDDKILKFVDLMITQNIIAPLPTAYWKISDVLIDKEEYVQNWVYNKSFQKLWDNIELLRNALFYTAGRCRSYQPPKYSKELISIGQNEIVTSTVVNRILGYLWVNFTSLIDFFDPNCQDNINGT